jgi:hypothetical protein
MTDLTKKVLVLYVGGLDSEEGFFGLLLASSILTD